MEYLSQVDALLTTARGTLAHARNQAGNWPTCGKMLARALEQAVSAVFMAWDDPRKPGPKMHQAFDQRLCGLIDPATAVMIGWVWQREGHGPPETDTALLLTACTNVIEYLANLANGSPLPGWQPRPIPAPMGWTSLDGPGRDFLQAALGAARQICPGVRLILFGSRAAGTARPSSDYDIMFVFPANTPDDRQGQAVGEVNSVARRQGFEVDAAKCTDRDWDRPGHASRPLIDRVRRTGIEILAEPSPRTAG